MLLLIALALLVSADSGRLTYYDVGLGACGSTNTNSQHVVAMNQAQYAGSCGKCVLISYLGKSVKATVVDLCPSCGSGALDASPSVFSSLASLDLGVVQMSWVYVDCSSSVVSVPVVSVAVAVAAVPTVAAVVVAAASPAKKSSNTVVVVVGASSIRATSSPSAMLYTMPALLDRRACYVSNAKAALNGTLLNALL